MKRVLSSEGFRFLVSGGSLFLLDFTVFVVCRKVLGIEVVWAELIARSVGAATGFLLHKFFTFARPKGASAMSAQVQGVGYFATTAFNLLFSPFFISWLVLWMHPYELSAKMLGSGLLACETFLVFRYIFRGSKELNNDSLKSNI